MKPFSSKKHQRLLSEINVVPYIDVMLVLLVIFMITAPLLSQGVQVNLPQASAKPLAVKKEGPVIVSVDQQGRYYLNISQTPEIPIMASPLIAQVAAALSISKERAVLVKGDREVPYGKVIQVMVLLQNAGVEKVGLMTERSNLL